MFVRSGGFGDRKNNPITTVGQKNINVLLFFFKTFIRGTDQYVITVFIGYFFYFFDNISKESIYNLRNDNSYGITLVGFEGYCYGIGLVPQLFS